ncbi:MAG: hypothetical protein ACLT8E_08395 [Akkermansia sp.]
MAAWEVYCLTGTPAGWPVPAACWKRGMRDEQVLAHQRPGERGVIFPGLAGTELPGVMTSRTSGFMYFPPWFCMRRPAVLARMFRELGLEEKARNGRKKRLPVRRHRAVFPDSGHALYGQCLYGRGYPVLSEKVDSLGSLLCVLLGQAWSPCRRNGSRPPPLRTAFPVSIPRCRTACRLTTTVPCGRSWRLRAGRGGGGE